MDQILEQLNISDEVPVEAPKGMVAIIASAGYCECGSFCDCNCNCSFCPCTARTLIKN